MYNFSLILRAMSHPAFMAILNFRFGWNHLKDKSLSMISSIYPRQLQSAIHSRPVYDSILMRNWLLIYFNKIFAARCPIQLSCIQITGGKVVTKNCLHSTHLIFNLSLVKRTQNTLENISHHLRHIIFF